MVSASIESLRKEIEQLEALHKYIAQFKEFFQGQMLKRFRMQENNLKLQKRNNKLQKSYNSFLKSEGVIEYTNKEEMSIMWTECFCFALCKQNAK